MNFVHDALADRRPFRMLTVVDQWSRHSPLLKVGARQSGQTVGEALDRVLPEPPRPRSMTVDHGPEFQSRALEDWVYCRGFSMTDRRRCGNAGISPLTTAELPSTPWALVRSLRFLPLVPSLQTPRVATASPPHVFTVAAAFADTQATRALRSRTLPVITVRDAMPAPNSFTFVATPTLRWSLG